MEELSDEFILSGDEMVNVDDLFTDNEEKETQETPPEKEEKEKNRNKSY